MDNKVSYEDKAIIKIVKIIVGLFILGTVFLGYNFHLSYELTFISNSSCGLLLLLDGTVSLFKKKALPAFLYQLVLPCINTVFFTIIFKLFGWHDFNFSGMFFFMHGINPIIFLLMYLFFTELELKDKKDYVRRIFIAPAMIMAYALFDLIRFFITGELVYGLISADKLNFISVPLIGIGLYLLMAFMSYGLLDLKLYVQKKTAR
ncbi:MAG: hypothetical protein SOU50_09270 [Oscillospiraceae bacterium]|nr:hypothetical protein [Oscillospiraceae bacterium]MDY2848387.1 hypothetical protein [Oscillospiraceae bacterium]